MIWQVGHDHAEPAGDVGIGQEVPPLLAVRPGGVLANQRNALSGFFEIHAIFNALNFEPDVTADRGLELRHGSGPP
jgi:hypothetical protein